MGRFFSLALPPEDGVPTGALTPQYAPFRLPRNAVFRRQLFMLSVCLAITVSSAEVFYHNPVIPGDYPDPSIILVGKQFWATSTSSEWCSQFPLLHSTDLVNWELAGAVFKHRPDWAI